MVWDAQFENIVRTHLYDLGPDTPLDPEVPLRDLGLDSLDTVALMVDLEEGFQMSFDDSELSTETFDTATSLWRVVRKHTEEQG